MQVIEHLMKGLSLIGIGATMRFCETDQTVLSIIDDVMNKNKLNDRRNVMSDFGKVRTDLDKVFNSIG